MVRSSRLAAWLCALAPAAALPQSPAAEPPRLAVEAARPAPAAVGPAAAPEAARPAGEPEVEIKTLEERVGELKERIHRTKARLQGLQELALGGDLSAGARAVVVHRNEMGSSYVLEAATFAFDGAPVWARADAPGELDRRDEIPVFDGRVAPGNHQISLRLTYRGRGSDAARFQVESAYTFTAEAGKVTRVLIVGHERSGARLEDRPAVRYDLEARKEEPARRRAEAEGAAR